MHAEVEALVSVFSGEEMRYPNGDRAQYLDLTFRCRYTGGQAAVGDDESTDVGWFSVAQLPPINPRFRMVIADAVAQMKHPGGFRPRMGYRKRS